MKHHTKDVTGIYEQYGLIVEKQRLEEEYDVGRDPNMMARIEDLLNKSGANITRISPDDARTLASLVNNMHDSQESRRTLRSHLGKLTNNATRDMAGLESQLADIMRPNLMQRAGQAVGRGARAVANKAGELGDAAARGAQELGFADKSERDMDEPLGTLDPEYGASRGMEQDPNEWEDDPSSAPVDQPGFLKSVGQGASLPGPGEERGAVAQGDLTDLDLQQGDQPFYSSTARRQQQFRRSGQGPHSRPTPGSELERRVDDHERRNAPNVEDF